MIGSLERLSPRGSIHCSHIKYQLCSDHRSCNFAIADTSHGKPLPPRHPDRVVERSAACFVSTLRLNSLPELAGRQSSALGQRVKFGKGEAGIGEMAQTAIGAGDDVFFAD